MAGAGGGGCPAGGNDLQWCFSQVKGAVDEDVAEADIISTVEFNYSGDLLATGDKGGRVVIFQREQENKSRPHSRGEYNVYSTFQSHEPEFDYLKSLEIEEKINKIRWLPQQNAAHFLLSTNGRFCFELRGQDKTIKLWKISERDKRAEGYNLKDEDGRLRDPFRITALRVPILKPMDLMVEASPRRIFANAHTYHINSISVNSDHETYLSADDLRINLWHLEITDRSFNIVDIKPVNMEELTEVITAAEFHPLQCNVLVYSSSKGTIRLCDMRSSALCDRHSKFFEEPEDPSSRSFFSEIISSISDVKFSHSGRYMMTRDYLSVKVWDLNMESRPVETHQVHEYLRSKLCSLYENDCIFDKFECCWSGSDRYREQRPVSGGHDRCLLTLGSEHRSDRSASVPTLTERRFLCREPLRAAPVGASRCWRPHAPTSVPAALVCGWTAAPSPSFPPSLPPDSALVATSPACVREPDGGFVLTSHVVGRPGGSVREASASAQVLISGPWEGAPRPALGSAGGLLLPLPLPCARALCLSDNILENKQEIHM
ncbi:serine/threonine-protein phosphatase 2A 55 kDa regulatory subunit B delta isoform isoform X3 [Mustela erminea]|uniref:serine/threonine-protein phosphatase 2A 55 kDa regulatory subunit B delta isoform isoform X3 n=1 Tax=Mustela erminea TaxID=36723 RepID=UPI0013870DF6|nr:serine/threonine-protein phosphatase 2A 55 kDa regulatory subunit B delta isoform isoform X3 [Mustela erminea]